jgi:hypothetical protein
MTTHARIYRLLCPEAARLDLDGGTRFWKELIREGRWVNAAAGFTLEVDRARLERWAERFRDMTDAGIRVPVPWGHSYDPRDNAGFLEEIELRDGGLWALLNIPDPDDARKLGSTVHGVSVSVHPRFVDGSGRDWGEVIEHVALTNYPVVTDQGRFVYAAHDDAEARPAVALELAPAEPDATATHDPVTRDAESPEPRPPASPPDDDEAPEPGAEAPPAPEPEDPPAAEPPPPADPPIPSSAPLAGGPGGRVLQLELERAERDLDDALAEGKFTGPAAEALRELLAAGVEQRYTLGPPPAGRDGPDVLRLAREIIAHTPPGAAVDLAEHTRRFPVPEPGSEMTDARAARLARENRKLAGV